MTTESQQRLTDHVVSTAERLETLTFDDEGEAVDEDGDPFDPLEVKFEVSLSGTVSETTAVLCTGGPQIEVALSSGRVDGWWGGDEHSTHVNDPNGVLAALEERYREMFEESVLA